MKRKILTIALFAITLICLFAIGVGAAEKTLDTNSLEEIKATINESSVGDEITVNLTGDMIIPSTSAAIVLDKDITVTINFNNHIIVYSGNGGGAGAAYGMAVKSSGARLILNGNTDVDYLNYTEPTDEEIKVSNGQIVNPNPEGTVYPDYVGNGPLVVVFNGTVELNDIYVRNFNTGEWTIFFCPNMSGINMSNNIKATNSIVRAPKSRYAALGTRNFGQNLTESLVEIDGCVIYGTSDTEWLSMSADSYIRNSRMTLNSVKIDSYLRDNHAREGHEAVLENVIFEHNKISSNTGATYVKMIDCQFPNGMELYVTGDSQGKTVFTIIETSTCETAGRKASITCWKGGGKTITSFDGFTDVDEEYTALNPALGHDNQSLAIYENGFTSEGYKRVGCTRCDDYVAGKLSPLFKNLGYSVDEEGNGGMTISFRANSEAILEYEAITGSTVNYGVFATTKASVGNNDAFDENGAPRTGVFAADVTKSGFNIFSLKMFNFTDEQKKIEIAMGAFVGTTKSSVTEYAYMQIAKPTDGEKYFFASFNDVLKMK